MRFWVLIAAGIWTGLLAGCTHRTGNMGFSGRQVEPAYVRIGSWDMRFLGPSSHNRNESRSPEDIAAYIAESGASAIALQSVGETPGMHGRNSTLESALQILRQQGQGDWDYVLFATQSNAQEQLTGIAWNKAVLIKEDGDYALPVPQAEISPSDNELLFDRPPHAVKFATLGGHFDFVMVPIHLQSNLGPGDHVAHRVTEVKVLAREVARAREHFNDRDIVLLGNFSIANSAETTQRLLTREGLRDLNSADYPTQINGMPDDRIFVLASDPAFRDVSAVNVVRMPGMSDEAFRRRLSDHFMITVDVKVTGDRD